MPVIDGELQTLSEEEIEDFLADALIDELGEDIDLSEKSVLRTIIRMVASSQANEINPALQQIYQDSFLDTASGSALDKIVEILGVSRIGDRRATGVVTMSRQDPAEQTYIIGANTIVQTDGSAAINFGTTNSVGLTLYDDFEANTLGDYSGLPNEFAITDDPAFVFDGEFALQHTGSADSAIWQTPSQQLTTKGRRLSIRVLAPSGSRPRQLFGTANNNNTYYTEIDTTAGTASEAAHIIGVRDAGSEEVLVTETFTFEETDYVENEIDWGLEGDIESIIRVNDEVVSTVSVSDEMSFLSGGYGFENGTDVDCYWGVYTSYSTSVNVRALEGGPDGNVGSNRLTAFPSVPSGVESVTNVYPTGDTRRSDISGNPYIAGRPRETDDELRERVRGTVGEAGSATLEAIASNLVELDGVESVSVFENKDDSIDAAGRPANSFEAVVFGGNEQAILEEIYHTKAATANDVGGFVGDKITGTVNSDATNQSFEIEFSRPSGVQILLTLDAVVDETYIGNPELRDKIVRFIGGETTDGVSFTGLGVGEDVLIDKLRDVIVNDDTGVVGIQSLSVTPTPVNNAQGLDVVEIADNETANADANDGSLVINTVEQE